MKIFNNSKDEGKVVELQEKIDLLELEKIDFENEFLEIQNKIDLLSQDKINLEKTNSELADKLDRLQNDKKVLQTNIENLKIRTTNLQQELIAKEMINKDKDDKINDLGLDLMDCRNEIKKNLRDLETFNEILKENKQLKLVIAEKDINIDKKIEIKYTNSRIQWLMIDNIIGISPIQKESNGFKFFLHLKNDIDGIKYVPIIAQFNEIDKTIIQCERRIYEEYDRFLKVL